MTKPYTNGGMRFQLADGAPPAIDRAALSDSVPYQLCPECDGLVMAQGSGCFAAAGRGRLVVGHYLAFACPLCGSQWAFELNYTFEEPTP